MRPRYLLLLFESPPADAFADRLARCLGLRIGFRSDRLSALVNRSCACLPLERTGCLLGTLFHRHGPARPLRAVEAAEARAIVESGGDHLLTRFWGGYVAALPLGITTRIIRDPSAALPCYFARSGKVTAFASDAELLIESGMAGVQLDWRALGAHLYAAGVPTAATALAGIDELLAGFGVELPGDGNRQRPHWSPWDYVQSGSTVRSERLARVVKHSVASWASAHGPLLLSCSGGLDSSIVAAALAHSRADVTCLTMYGDDPGGDERPFARGLCQHLRLQLIERPYRVEDIDIDEPLGSHLPRPSDRTHALSYEHAHLEVADAIKAAAFITGNGGDSVFAYSQSAAAAADRYLCEGVGGGLMRTLRDISVQTGCGLASAAAAAFRIARGPRAYCCRPDAAFLHPEFLHSVSRSVLEHPWLEPPAHALPGKAAHIASVLRMQQCLEATRGRHLPLINPLMSQPVIETCLAVPAWEWRVGGRDRSLARRAFSADLPLAILQRKVKGGPDGFAAKVLEHFRSPITERLLDGRLVRNGIADRGALELALKSNRPIGGEQRARLLELVAVEAWATSWLSRTTAIPHGGPVSR